MNRYCIVVRDGEVIAVEWLCANTTHKALLIDGDRVYVSADDIDRAKEIAIKEVG